METWITFDASKDLYDVFAGVLEPDKDYKVKTIEFKDGNKTYGVYNGRSIVSVSDYFVYKAESCLPIKPEEGFENLVYCEPVIKTRYAGIPFKNLSEEQKQFLYKKLPNLDKSQSGACSFCFKASTGVWFTSNLVASEHTRTVISFNDIFVEDIHA